MSDIQAYIASGIIESYLLGFTSEEESQEFESMLLQYPEIQEEVAVVSESLETIARTHEIQPDPTVKPFLMATVDFIKRMEGGETPSFPPILNENSSIEDYKPWIDREDMVLTPDFEGVYARIIGHSPECISAIAWIEYMAPPEVHDNEYEKFLILEGTCDITIGETVHSLVPGDVLTIPLHVNHFVQVTSEMPCKVILQRVAA